jgi:hypothetical protein
MSWILFNRNLSIEFRAGTGLDIEFVDSRPVYTQNSLTGEIETMPFQGVIILLPCIIISWGNVYTIEEDYSE